MVIVEILIALLVWFASGHAIEKIYDKAGFVDTPKFIFWIPALNVSLLLYLAFVRWPAFEQEVS